MKDFTEDIKDYLEADGIDASNGTAISEFVVKPCALLLNKTFAEFQTTLDNMSLANAEEQYAITLLENIDLAPSEAGVGNGYLMLKLDSADDFVIHTTDTFTVGGNIVSTEEDYLCAVGVTDVSENYYINIDKHIDGFYYAQVAASTLSAMVGDIAANTIAVPGQAMPGLVEATTSAFISEQLEQTVDSLRSEALSGLSAKILAGSAHNDALLKNAETLHVLGTTTVGSLDIEMRRDKASTYAVGTGGCADIYIKTVNASVSETVSVVGTRMVDGSYSVVLDKNNITSCLLAITSIGYADNAAILPALDYTFTADDTGEQIEHKGNTGRFTATQKCVARFNIDSVPDTDIAPVFRITFSAIPGIKQVHDYVDSPETASPTTDFLIKAMSPLELSVSLQVSYRVGDGIPDTDAISNLLVEYINNIESGRRFLSGAELAVAVNKQFTNIVVKMPMHIVGGVYDTNATKLYVDSYDTLNIPNRPDIGITNNTTYFSITPDNISVSLIGDL